MGFSVQAAMNLLPGLEWAPDCTQASSAKVAEGWLFVGVERGCPCTWIGSPLRCKMEEGMRRGEGWAAGQGQGDSSPQPSTLQSEL